MSNIVTLAQIKTYLDQNPLHWLTTIDKEGCAQVTRKPESSKSYVIVYSDNGVTCTKGMIEVVDKIEVR